MSSFVKDGGLPPMKGKPERETPENAFLNRNGDVVTPSTGDNRHPDDIKAGWHNDNLAD